MMTTVLIESLTTYCTYGYLTWEWTSKIRSYAHPILFAIIYKLLAWLRLDETRLLVGYNNIFIINTKANMLTGK